MLLFWFLILVMILCYLLAFGLASLVYHRTASPELARKTVHLAVVIISISHFFVFTSPWQSFIVGNVFFYSLIALRFLKPGFFLFKVKRKSPGDLLLMLGLIVPVILGRQAVVISITAMLVLGISDSLAALIGQTGHTVLVFYNRKTSRGILAFFLSALLIICGGVAVYTGTFSLLLLEICFISALIVTLIEAVSTRGIDNLLIPLTVFVLLKSGLEFVNYFPVSFSGFLILSLLLAWLFMTLQNHQAGVKHET